MGIQIRNKCWIVNNLNFADVIVSTPNYLIKKGDLFFKYLPSIEITFVYKVNEFIFVNFANLMAILNKMNDQIEYKDVFRDLRTIRTLCFSN